jgi:hypothetical protein
MVLGVPTFTAVTVNRITSAAASYVDLLVQCDGATSFTIERSKLIGGGTVIVRGADAADPTGPDTLHTFDYEAPVGVPLTYTAVATDGVDSATIVTTADPVDHGGDWLMPVARPELGMLITVEKGGVGGLSRNLQQSTSQVINRRDPVIVTYGRASWSGPWTLLTLNEGERIDFLSILEFPHLMFTPRYKYGFEEPIFCVFTETTEQRVVSWGGEEARRWNVDVVQVERPPAYYKPPPPTHTWGSRLGEASTWQEVVSSYLDWFDYTGYRGD